MKRFSIKGLIPALLVALTVGVVAGAPVLARSSVQATDGLTSVAKDTVVDGAAFLAGDTVTIDGIVKGDVFCAGNTVTIAGTVEGDVLCGGNNLTISGTVEGDVRVGGNTILLKGDVKGSVSVAANSVVTENTFKLGRDMTAGASSVSLSGVIGRDLRFGAGSVTLTGLVGRNADGAVESLRVADGAKIAGNLMYISASEGVIAADSVVGTTQRQQPDSTSSTTPQMAFSALMSALFMGAVLFVVFVLFVALIVPKYLRSVTLPYTGGRSFFKAAVVGLAAFFAIVPITLIAFLSGIGVFVGVFLLVAYTLALMVSGALVSYRLGLFMVGKRTANIFISAGVGAVTLAVLAMIPVVGLIVLFAASGIGLGMIILGFAAQYEGYPYRGIDVTSAHKKTANKLKS